MHDAAEAFIGDVTRPLKSLLGTYKIVESNIEQAIAYRFRVAGTDAAEIKNADLQMLQAERFALMPPSPEGEWPLFAGVEPVHVDLRCWGPGEAKEQFLRRFSELQQ
ncbi:hypothetical protein [Sphingomonas sp.]|jgi:hypothetical protein|uniref:hypothetical protein n=1 Tax=Sphingomonas sp. TaxID=28214 RepID=UPI002D7F85F1|nr:hypothetical protein [Sphingomonas sp.]HEU0045103.1 hypothetical protein [Sphingomonas sp.]